MSHQETTNVSSLLMQAARSAAIADGVAVPLDTLSSNQSIGNVTNESDVLALSHNSNGGGHSTQCHVPESRAGHPTEVSAKNVNVQDTNVFSKAVKSGSAAGGGGGGGGVGGEQVRFVHVDGSSSAADKKHNDNIPRNETVVALPGNSSNSTSQPHNRHDAPSAGAAAHLASQNMTVTKSMPLSAGVTNAAGTPSSPSPSAPLPTASSAGASSTRTGNHDAANGHMTGGGKKKGPPLRRGKWSAEEEAYANRLIMEFKAGLLPLTDGTTLRTFLSKLLNCDPMRISKKFVGNNCIGKQVFRRRTADINRLTPEQIQQSRVELSELERRFLEKVAQTNRLKTSGVSNNSNSNEPSNDVPLAATTTAKVKEDNMANGQGVTPPWLRPPNGFKHGTGAATAAAHLSSGSNHRAAAMAGRALLQGYSSDYGNQNKHMPSMHSTNLNKSTSAGLLALMELQQRQGIGNNLLSTGGLGSNSSTSNFLAAAAAAARMERENKSNNSHGRDSMLDLMLKSGLSRDQLNHLVNEHRDTSNSLSDMLQRQSSLDALMSLDFQSLQSIDNLANLIQNGRGNTGPRLGSKNWQSDSNASANNLAAHVASMGSNNSLSNLANARRLQSEGRMENLIRSLSNNNFARGQMSSGSNPNFNSLLQSMQNNLGGNSNSMLNSASAFDLANMLRADSSTGLTALRMQEGLTQRNSSVDDFLSLVASGDIPHQDPHLLNIPLQSLLQQQQQSSNNSAATAQLLAQQQLLSQTANGGGNSLNRFASLNNFSTNNLQGNLSSNNRTSGLSSSNSINAFGEHLSSLGQLGGNNSAVSLLSHYASQQGSLGNFSQYQHHGQNQPQQTPTDRKSVV